MPLTYRHVMALALLVGCGTEPASTAEPTAEETTRARAEVDLATLVVDADRRVRSEAITGALHDPDASNRRAAALALARLQSIDGAGALRLALRDTDPAVRDAASLGLGGLEDDAPEAVAEALTVAIAAEPDAATRAHMIRDLGRLRREDGLPVVAAALRAEHSPERAAACAAAAERGLAGGDVPGAIRSRLAALLGAEEPDEVRRACAYALARLPAPSTPEAPAEAVALTIAATDPDPEVRTLAYRALGRHPGIEVLVHGTRDDDYRVAVQAFRSLATRAAIEPGGPAVYAAALTEAHRAFASEPGAGPRLHVLLTALEGAGPIARSTPVHDVAVRMLEALGALPADQPPTRERGLAHCAAAELVDRGRGWPSRIDACGLEQVLPREQLARTAAILGEVEGAEEQRLARLGRLVRHDQPLVREAALAAAARIWAPASTDLVLRALSDEDPGVLAAALEALATIARRAPTEARVPPPLPTDRAVAGLRAARSVLDEGELEGLVGWLDAADAVSASELVEEVRALASHPSHAPRDRARALLATWNEASPGGPAAAVPDPIGAAQLLPPDARPRVRLETDRGVLVLELRPDHAPVTVTRILGLVRDGYYDGLTFHRVVPGFVVQGGDPRGDGYGGPGFWLRCEDNRLPYVRGTVGMALAGRDTGGSQFFITSAAQPHLEGRYTAFGAVIDGLDSLDRLHPGDRIRRATVVDVSN